MRTRAAGRVLAAVVVLTAVAPAHSAAAASGFDPYDPDDLTVIVRRADNGGVSANWVTLDTVVSDKQGAPVGADYAVSMTFNQPGREVLEPTAHCTPPDRNSVGVYRCNGIVFAPGDWDFHVVVTQPGSWPHIVRTVDATLSIPDAVRLPEGERPFRLQSNVGARSGPLWLRCLLVAGVASLPLGVVVWMFRKRLRRPPFLGSTGEG